MLPKYATISHRKSIHHRTFNLYSVSILVSIYLSLFGSYKNIISIIVERLGIIVDRRVCQRIANRIGFKGNVKELPDIPIKYLTRLPVGHEYPPTNYIVFENSTAPFPNKPKVIDPSCGHPRDFHRLNESKLAYTLEADDSAIFLDTETDELVAIVIRGLAKDYINIIQPWAVDLIVNSLNRRRPTQRNNPKMAQVGVSTGARSASLFGWVRNLFERFQKASDEQQHEYNISSLSLGMP